MRMDVATHHRDITSYSSKGASDPLKDTQRAIMWIEHYHRYAFATEALNTIARECSEANWDGYDARPISNDAYSEAQKLLRLIPVGLPMPDVTPEPAGPVAFEWHKGDHFLILSVEGRGTISYAGGSLQDASDDTHGTVRFHDALPDAIVERIRFLL